MIDDEKQIVDFLKEYNLKPKEFTKIEKKQSKTPDFRVFKSKKLIFYCEVKSIKKDDFDDLVLKHGFYVRTGKDPADDIISSKIHQAHKQFSAVNKDFDLPNVLVFVNHERTFAWEFGGLHRVVAEVVALDDGTYIHVGNRAINGRIKTEKFGIHLYIWMDDFNQSDPGFLFVPFQSKHYRDLRNYFGKDPKQIDMQKVRPRKI